MPKPRNLGGRPRISRAEMVRRGTFKPYKARGRRGDDPEFEAPPCPKWFTPAMRENYLAAWERSTMARPVASKAEAVERSRGLLKWVRFHKDASDAAPDRETLERCGYSDEEWAEHCAEWNERCDRWEAEGMSPRPRMEYRPSATGKSRR